MWEDTSVNTQDTHGKEIHSGGREARCERACFKGLAQCAVSIQTQTSSITHYITCQRLVERRTDRAFPPGFSETRALVPTAPRRLASIHFTVPQP